MSQLGLARKRRGVPICSVSTSSGFGAETERPTMTATTFGAHRISCGMRWLIVVLCAVVVTAVCSSCAGPSCSPPAGGRCRHPMPVDGGSVAPSADGRTLSIMTNCGGTLTASRTPTRVTLTYTASAVGKGGLACARRPISVILDTPVGSLPIYDSVSGQRLTVVDHLRYYGNS